MGYRTNCAILMSYICADPTSSPGPSPRRFSKWRIVVKIVEEKALGTKLRADPLTCRGESCEILLPIFHSDGREQGREEEPGLLYVLLCSDLMEKVCFFRVDNFFNFAL